MVLTDFRERIENTINNSNLSIDVVYFVLKDVMTEVEVLYNSILQGERAKKQAALEEQEKKEKESTNDEDINKENDAEESVE